MKKSFLRILPNLPLTQAGATELAEPQFLFCAVEGSVRCPSGCPGDKISKQMCTSRMKGYDAKPKDQMEACHLLSTRNANLERGVLVLKYTHAVVTGKAKSAAYSLTQPNLHLVLLWGLGKE